MENKIKAIISVVIVVAVIGSGAGLYEHFAASNQQQEVVIYADYSPSLVQPLFNDFQNATGIKAVVQYGAMGTLQGKLIASRNAPQADVLFGGAPSAYISVENQSILQSYTPSALANQSEYIGNHVLWRSGNWTWFPYSYAVLGLSINYHLLANSSDPTNFTNLTNPIYKGKIVLENPATSTTTGIAFYSMVEQYYINHYGNTTGTQKFVSYMRALFNNSVAQTPSDDENAEVVLGQGGGAITIDWSYMPTLYQQLNGYTLKPQLLSTAVLGASAMALVNGAPHQKAAEAFVNWILSKQGQTDIGTILHKPPVISGVPIPAGSFSLSSIIPVAFPYNQSFTVSHATQIDNLFTTYDS
ncbi:MAG: extracellular solute-binding protein [Candidatus Thermoplasmatota archaeon]|nr:extracellular solute-binding protein [Candidatus Thermoplasmatota archaeon]MCL5955588.1 extracellular solute-binding protein [Candidatus Thermoplasmatota archaeon]